MGREVRRVPADWVHPKKDGRYTPLHDGSQLAEAIATWDIGNAKWSEGLRDDYRGGWQPIGDVSAKTYTDWDSERPDPSDYMPVWTPEEATHYQMYEDTTEGTPISPVMETPEALTRWLVDNNASAFAGETASYEAWLNIARGEWAPSAMFSPSTGLISGVEATTIKEDNQMPNPTDTKQIGIRLYPATQTALDAYKEAFKQNTGQDMSVNKYVNDLIIADAKTRTRKSEDANGQSA